MKTLTFLLRTNVLTGTIVGLMFLSKYLLNGPKSDSFWTSIQVICIYLICIEMYFTLLKVVYKYFKGDSSGKTNNDKDPR